MVMVVAVFEFGRTTAGIGSGSMNFVSMDVSIGMGSAAARADFDEQEKKAEAAAAATVLRSRLRRSMREAANGCISIIFRQRVQRARSLWNKIRNCGGSLCHGLLRLCRREVISLPVMEIQMEFRIIICFLC